MIFYTTLFNKKGVAVDLVEFHCFALLPVTGMQRHWKGKNYEFTKVDGKTIHAKEY